MIIQKFCEISCLIVLDNYEDVEAVVGKANQEKEIGGSLKKSNKKAQLKLKEVVFLSLLGSKSKKDEVTQLFITIDFGER